MFTNKDLRNLIVPLFIEQFLLMFVGIADTFVAVLPARRRCPAFRWSRRLIPC